MTNINTFEEILQAMERNPALRDAMRRHILTEELLQLPTQVSRMETDLTDLRQNVTELKADVTELEGGSSPAGKRVKPGWRPTWLA